MNACLPPTMGEIIRALKKYYPETCDLNEAVNEHRRATAAKNYYAAALDLLKSLWNKEEV